MPRNGRLVVRLTAAGLLAAAFGSPHEALAASAPSLRSATFTRPAVDGRVSQLQFQATDTERAVSGAMVSSEGAVTSASSACRAEDSSGDVRGTAFQPGRRVAVAVPHRFRRGTDPRSMVVRLDSEGCSGGGGYLLAPFTVTPSAPGEPPNPLVSAGSPIAFLGDADGTITGTTGGSLPGGIDLPPLPSVPVTTSETSTVLPLPQVNVPTAETPEVPTLPSLPTLGEGDVLPLRAPARTATCRDATLVPNAQNIGRIERATVCLVNALRRALGRRPLRNDRRMALAARRHSAAMVRGAFFAHVDPQGRDVVGRLRRARWLPRPPYWMASENLAAADAAAATPQATVEAWWNSTAHRQNMIDRAFNVGGLGVVAGFPGRPDLPGATYTHDLGQISRR